MNVFVAGGAGFIGSHLVDALLAEGHRVICVDKLIMGKQNIAHINEGDSFRFFETDLSVQKDVDHIFETEKIDAVYHLAANSDIQKGGKEPEIECICKTESLCCLPETNTTLYINYTSVKKRRKKCHFSFHDPSLSFYP